MTNKNILNAWAKMELNSCYGFPPITNFSRFYDESKSHQITEIGKQFLLLIKNYGK